MKGILNKYEVGECQTSFTRWTFKPDGYYETLKRKLLSKYSAAELQDNTHSKRLSLQIVALFIAVFLVTCYTRNYFIAAIAGFLLVGVVGEGHNLMHQKKNPYRYLFSLTGLTHEDWENFHTISHHMHPNSELDYEIGMFEPLAYFLRNQPNNPFYIEIVLQPFFFLMIPLNMIIKIAHAVVTPSKFSLSMLYPFT